MIKIKNYASLQWFGWQESVVTTLIGWVPFSLLRRSRWQESVVTTLIGWVPFSLGVVIRRLMYRTIFMQIGTFVEIHSDIRFSCPNRIKIGNQVRIDSGVHLKNIDDSKIWIGDRVHIERGVDIKAHHSGKIEIGENTSIGPYVCFAGESIKVGKDCLIASHSGIYANNHNFVDPTRKIKEQGVSYEGIVIEDDCWLGSGVRVLDGVTIGQGSVVGAGAIVTKDIPPYSIAVGVPARVIASRKFGEALFTQNKKSNCEEGRQLPNLLSAALAEVKETAELIYDEVEEAIAEQLHYYVAPTDMVPTDLFLQTLLHQLLSCTRQVMNVDTVAVLLKTEDGQQLAVRATIGLEEEITEEIRIPIGQGFAGRIAASREVTIVDDLSKVEVVSPILRDKGLQSMLGVPLLVKDRVIGVFHVGTIPPHQFTEEDAQLLKLVADHVGLVTERLAISRQSLINDSVLIRREKFGLINSLQETRRTIGNLGGNLLPKALLELAPPRWLVSTSC